MFYVFESLLLCCYGATRFFLGGCFEKTVAMMLICSVCVTGHCYAVAKWLLVCYYGIITFSWWLLRCCYAFADFISALVSGY